MEYLFIFNVLCNVSFLCSKDKTIMIFLILYNITINYKWEFITFITTSKKNCKTNIKWHLIKKKFNNNFY